MNRIYVRLVSKPLYVAELDFFNVKTVVALNYGVIIS